MTNIIQNRTKLLEREETWDLGKFMLPDISINREPYNQRLSVFYVFKEGSRVGVTCELAQILFDGHPGLGETKRYRSILKNTDPSLKEPVSRSYVNDLIMFKETHPLERSDVYSDWDPKIVDALRELPDYVRDVFGNELFE